MGEVERQVVVQVREVEAPAVGAVEVLVGVGVVQEVEVVESEEARDLEVAAEVAEVAELLVETEVSAPPRALEVR